MRNYDSSGLHGASGDNCVPLAVLYKGKYRREEFGVVLMQEVRLL
jgi:hypothetical protein